MPTARVSSICITERGSGGALTDESSHFGKAQQNPTVLYLTGAELRVPLPECPGLDP